MNDTRTPEWLVRSEPALCPCGCIGRRRKGSFVEKTLTGASDVMRRVLSSDDTSAQDGLLQRLDARVKLLSTAVLLVVAGLVHHIAVLLVLYGGALALAAASRLSIAMFVKRVWLFVPLFTGVVVLPATFNVVTPGHVVVSFGHWWFGREIGITSQGLHGASLIVVRVAVSISLVLLLTITTSWPRLLGGLRALLVPRMFVAVLGMAHRYVFQLLGTVTDMYTARKARPAGERGTRAGRAFVASTAGALLGKAHALSEEVHQAMVARGYQGDAVALVAPRLTVADLVWVMTCAGAAVLTLGADHVLAG
ncbi:MAG: cobalt/nickel transport system permease protein [Actinomycetota bacterium]|nr:cobalt/nickel transport system permease protein [Actinomycetota bacterium]